MKDRGAVTNPHDLYFTSTFGMVEFAKDFLSNYLPRELAEIVNLDTLAHEQGSYLDERLKKQFTDLVYTARIKEETAYITFLFEHKSSQDRMVIFQVLKYMVAIWEAKIKEEHEAKKYSEERLATEDTEIPIILPIVVYHDKYEWKVKRSLGEMMPQFRTLPDIIKQYIPDFRYLLADLGHFLSDSRIDLKDEHAIVIETLSKARYESKEKVIDLFRRVVEIYTKRTDKDMVVPYIISTIVYIISTRDDFDETELKEIADQISEKGGELFMTLAERLMERGRQEGRQEGMERGLQKGRQEIARRLLADGMGDDLVAKYSKLSVEEVRKIRRQE